MDAAITMTADIINAANVAGCEATGGDDYACIIIPGGVVVDVNVFAGEDGQVVACAEVDDPMVSHFFDVIKGESPADFVARVKACPVAHDLPRRRII